MSECTYCGDPTEPGEGVFCSNSCKQMDAADLQELKKSKWIDLKEERPNDGDSILICGPNLYTCQAHVWEGSWLGDGMIAEEVDVTHWMPLPEPYKK